MTGIFLTTEILGEATAASKARLDVQNIIQKAGYSLFALPYYTDLTQFVKLWRELSALTGKGAHVVIEYPFKARLRLYVVYIIARLKGIQLYGIIHDIGSLRKQTRSIRDMVVIQLFDGLVSHNASMTGWLRKKGYKKKIVQLELFDYLLKTHKSFAEPSFSDRLKLLYAGHLGYKKAAYIYDKRFCTYTGVDISLYGPFFEKEMVNGSPVRYKGVFDPHEPDLDDNYHFGLIWEGTSTDTCKGVIGEYIRYNNPHKLSLYIALGLPVIVWRGAAVASFVVENGIGLTIDSLNDLSKIREKLDQPTYEHFVKNISNLRQKVTRGYFLGAALNRLTVD